MSIVSTYARVLHPFFHIRFFFFGEHHPPPEPPLYRSPDLHASMVVGVARDGARGGPSWRRGGLIFQTDDVHSFRTERVLLMDVNSGRVSRLSASNSIQ